MAATGCGQGDPDVRGVWVSFDGSRPVSLALSDENRYAILDGNEPIAYGSYRQDPSRLSLTQIAGANEPTSQFNTIFHGVDDLELRTLGASNLAIHFRRVAPVDKAMLMVNRALILRRGSGEPRLGRLESGPAAPAPDARSAQNKCFSNLSRLATVVSLYASDYDDQLPQGPKWQDATSPYAADDSIYRCPAAPAAGYAFNASLSGVARASVADSSKVILLFESNELRPNVSDGLASLLLSPRHGAVLIAYLDGHVGTR